MLKTESFQAISIQLIQNYHFFLALAVSDLIFIMSCFPRGVRIVAERTYFRIFPVTRFVSFFSYTTSIYLTVTLIIERYVHLARFSNMGCQIFIEGMHIKENLCFNFCNNQFLTSRKIEYVDFWQKTI